MPRVGLVPGVLTGLTNGAQVFMCWYNVAHEVLHYQLM